MSDEQAKSVAISIKSRPGAKQAGDAAFYGSIVFACGAIASALVAESAWSTAPANVGIGTSGYVMVLYLRAITCAVLSAACAGVSVYLKSRDDIVVTWRSVTAEDVDEAPALDPATPAAPKASAYSRRHNA